MVDTPCDSCSGSGFDEAISEVKLVVPPGVESGTRLRLRGQGDEAKGGGPRGDLYVELNVLPSEHFERRGPHLVTQVDISFVQAALGCQVEVPTIAGSRDYTIKPGTQPGDQIVLRGEGVPDRHGRGSGDLVALINVTVPTKLDGTQKELLEQYAEHSEIPIKKGKQGLFSRLRSKG